MFDKEGPHPLKFASVCKLQRFQHLKVNIYNDNAEEEKRKRSQDAEYYYNNKKIVHSNI